MLWSLVASSVALVQFFGVDVFDAWPPGWRQPSFLGHSDLAALSGINLELYEAAKVDGAGRWRQMLSVTLPGIAPTI